MGVSRWGGPRRTRRTPQPSSPWQPDQFANRRQPRLTYHVFVGLFFSYLPPRSSSLVLLRLLRRAATVLCVSAPFPSLVSFPFFSPLVSFAHTRLYIRNAREAGEKSCGAPFFPPDSSSVAFHPFPSVSLPLSLSLCTFFVRDQENEHKYIEKWVPH